MSNPWLKFYPSDWRADPSLRMCSIAARGLWMEMLCVMHENGGELSVNGKPVSARQLASLAGCSEVDDLLAELEDAGVFSRRDDGTIYSRRMIRDAEKAEADKANGRKGGNPMIKGVNPQIHDGVNPQDKAQKPETRNHTQKEEPNGSSKKAGCRIPADFAPDLGWAVAQGMSLSEAEFEAANFRDYWTAKSGRDATKNNWPLTWQVWVRNQIKRRPASRASPSRQPNLADGFAAIATEAEYRNDPRHSASDESPGRVVPYLPRVQSG